MNTKSAYSDEEMRKFQDIYFDAERVERLEERLKWLRRVSNGYVVGPATGVSPC